MFAPQDIPKAPLSPAQLDAQGRVQITEWVDINSPKAQELDDDPVLSVKWLVLGVQSGFICIDTMGRLWGAGDHGSYYPYHFQHGTNLYGYKVSTRASN